MPTLRDLYQQVLELHKQLDSLIADFEMAKKACESGGENDATWANYCQAIYDAVQKRVKNTNSKSFLDNILKEHNRLWRCINSFKLTPAQAKLRTVEEDKSKFKLNQQRRRVFPLLKNIDRDPVKFKRNIATLVTAELKKVKTERLYFSPTKNFPFSFRPFINPLVRTFEDTGNPLHYFFPDTYSPIGQTGNLLEFLPKNFSQQTGQDFFKALVSQCQTPRDVHCTLLLAGQQRNESPQFWQQLSEVFFKKGWSVYKHTSIAFVKQHDRTCFYVSAAAVMAHNSNLNSISYDPFYPDPRSQYALEQAINLYPATPKIDGATGSIDAATFGLRPLSLKEIGFLDALRSLDETGPLVVGVKVRSYAGYGWGRHAVIVTGYALNWETQQGFVLFTDPNSPGVTNCLPSDEFNRIVTEVYVASKAHKVTLKPNPYFNSDWYPGHKIAHEQLDNPRQWFLCCFSKSVDDQKLNVCRYNDRVFLDCWKGLHRYCQLWDYLVNYNVEEKALRVLRNYEARIKGRYYPNPLLDLRVRLGLEFALNGDFKKVEIVLSLPLENLITTYKDDIFKLYPTFKDYGIPVSFKPQGPIANDDNKPSGNARLSIQEKPQRTFVKTPENKPVPTRIQYQVVEKSLKVAGNHNSQPIEITQPVKIQPYERSGKDELNRLRPDINNEIKGFAASRGMAKQPPRYSNIYKASIVSQTSGAAGGIVAGWLGLPTDLGAVTSSLAEQGIIVTAQTIEMQGSWLNQAVAQFQQTMKTLSMNQQVSGMLNTWRGQAFAFFQRVEGQIIGVYGIMKAGGALLVHNVWTVVAANALPVTILLGKIVVAVGAVAALGYGISIVLEKFSDFLDEYFADPRLITTYTPEIKMVAGQASLEHSCTTALPSEYKPGVASLALAEMNQSPTMPWQAEQKFREFYSKAYIATDAGTNWVAAKEREHLEQREAFNEQKLKEKQLKEKIEIAIKKSSKNAMAVMNYIDQADMLALIIRNDHKTITNIMKPILRGQTKHLADQKTWLEFGYYDKVCAHFCYIMKDIIQLNLAYLKAVMHLEETNFLNDSAQDVATFKQRMQQINFSDYKGVKTSLNGLYKAFYTNAPDQHNPLSNALVDYHNALITIRDSYEIGLDELKAIHQGLIINNKLSNFLYTLTTQRQALVAEGRKMFGKILEKQ